jgi:hypothetical protein
MSSTSMPMSSTSTAMSSTSTPITLLGEGTGGLYSVTSSLLGAHNGSADGGYPGPYEWMVAQRVMAIASCSARHLALKKNMMRISEVFFSGYEVRRLIPSTILSERPKPGPGDLQALEPSQVQQSLKLGEARSGAATQPARNAAQQSAPSATVASASARILDSFPTPQPATSIPVHHWKGYNLRKWPPLLSRSPSISTS